MRKMLLSAVILTVLVTLGHSQENITLSDLLNGILIEGKDTLALKDGEYVDPTDSESDYYHSTLMQDTINML